MITYHWRGRFDNAAVNALHAEGLGHEPLDDDWWAQVNRHSLGWACAREGSQLVGFVNVAGITSYWATRRRACGPSDGSDALILARVAGNNAKAGSNSAALLASYAHLDNSAVRVRIGGPKHSLLPSMSRPGECQSVGCVDGTTRPGQFRL